MVFFNGLHPVDSRKTDRKCTVATPQVCFCDTELLAAGQTCSDAEDYSVELGKVRGERPSQCFLTSV